MKRIILLAFSMLALSFVHAQQKEQSFGFSKGNFILGGNISISSSNNETADEKTRSHMFSPGMAYFIKNNIALGVQISHFNEYKRVNKVVDETTGLGFEVFGSYYFLELGKRFKFFVTQGFGFLFGDSGNETFKYDYDGFVAGTSLGINYFITQKLVINLSLSDILHYTSLYYWYSGEGAKDYHVKEFKANFNIFNNFLTTSKFGLIYKL